MTRPSVSQVVRGSIRLAVALAITLAALGLDIGADPARAETPSFFAMTSAASAPSIELRVANAPLLAPQVLFVSPSSAQARVDSSGDSTAYASAPFFGQTIEGIGGLANGLANGAIPPLPRNLPGYVQSSHPTTPSTDNSQGPYVLHAESEQSSSSATSGIVAESAGSLLLGTKSTASTKIDSATGALTATAASVTQPVAISGLLQLGAIRATATVTVDPSGKLTKASALDLGSITVAGLRLGLTDTGLELLGTRLPISTSAVNSLLAPAGVSIEVLASTESANGIISAGLQVTLTRDVPVAGASAVILTIGQSSSEVVFGDQPGTAIDTSTPVADAPIVDIAAPLSVPPLNTEPDSAAPPLAAPSDSPEVLLTTRLGPDGTKFYLVLALAGLALIAESRLAAWFVLRRPATEIATSPDAGGLPSASKAKGDHRET